MRAIIILVLMIGFTSCKQENPQNSHQSPTHNFTVQRLLIVNDQNEVLMVEEQEVWAPPSFLFGKRQYLKESLDSLSNAYGVQIGTPELRGQFGFKYDYHPYATMRNYYVARYKSGEIKTPKGMNHAQWFPWEEAIEKNTVTAIKEISNQILRYPEVLWGGSFLVSHVGDEHPTKIVEEFYPL